MKRTDVPVDSPKRVYKILFRAVKIVFIGLFFLGTIFLLPDNQEDFAFFNVSQVFGQKEQIFLSPIEGNLIEPSNFVLINQNSLQATFPLTIHPSQILGGLIEDNLPENREIIIEYIVEEGDNLWSIADKFNISVETIAWANDLNLRRAIIRPGQKLVILPVSGVKHIVKERETISGIAEKYNIPAEKIIDFNNILDKGEISIGQALIIPGGKKQVIRIAERREIDLVERVVDRDFDNIEELTPNQVRAKLSTNNYWGQSHAFPFGQCTWWPAQRRPIGRWGHAKSWLDNAERDGFEVCRGRNCQPTVGAVLVIVGNPIFGHVAYVEEIRGNKIIFSEMNGISGWGRINKRIVEVGSNRIVGFIY